MLYREGGVEGCGGREHRLVNLEAIMVEWELSA
jgi:hypothetical protein